MRVKFWNFWQNILEETIGLRKETNAIREETNELRKESLKRDSRNEVLLKQLIALSKRVKLIERKH